MTKEYMAVSVPRDMISIIDAAIQGKGYNSRADFVKFCIRKELSKMKVKHEPE